jgi:hypothetical protein
MEAISITPQHIFKTGQILTVEAAKSLIGKTIATTSEEYYMNEPHVNVFTVAGIVNEWDMNAKEPMDGYISRQDYWISYMKADRINELKNTLMLLDNNGGWWHRAHNYTGIYEHPTFTGSDADRTVYYIVLN